VSPALSSCIPEEEEEEVTVIWLWGGHWTLARCGRHGCYVIVVDIIIIIVDVT